MSEFFSCQMCGKIHTTVGLCECGFDMSITNYDVYTDQDTYSNYELTKRIERAKENKDSLPKINTYEKRIEQLEAQEKLPAQEEGFVVRFSDGERVKFKGFEYLKIAKILSGCSPLTFWKSMIDGEVDQKLLEEIPEEFRPELDEIIEKLESQYEQILTEIQREAFIIGATLGLTRPVGEQFKKALGLKLKGEHNFKHPKVMFPFFLGNKEGVQKYIKNQIKPRGNVI